MTRVDDVCTFSDHVTGDLHAKQLKDRLADIQRLEAQVAALSAETRRRPARLSRESVELLTHLADALATAETFARPAPGAQVPDETRTGRQKPHGVEPKGGDPNARRALTDLTRSVVRALDSFESRQTNDWKPTTVRDVQATCDWCGEGFAAIRNVARFCSDVCRVKANRHLANAKRTP